METQGIILFAALLITIMGGVPIAFAMGFVSICGIFFLLGGSNALLAIGPLSWSTVATFMLSALPLYIFLGATISVIGVGSELYDGVAVWIRRIPGGLAVASTCAIGIFSAVSGSSVAAAATMGRIAIPEMKKHGYSPELTTGTVVAGATLDILIPPSIPMIIYGIATGTSIGQIYMAGFIPGAILVLLFSTYEILMAIKGHAVVPPYVPIPLKAKLSGLLKIGPFILLILSILGTIYTGIATVTEAAAIGILGSLVLGLFYGEMTLAKLHQALMQSIITTSMICIIIVGAMLYGYLLTATGICPALTKWILGLPVSRWVIFIGINTLFLFLGCFLEVISIIVITAPIVVPVIVALGFDPVWFGIVMVINMEMALITPPVGLNLYVVRGIAPEVPFSKILKGSLPFVALLAIGIFLLALFPDLALWLPKTMK